MDMRKKILIIAKAGAEDSFLTVIPVLHYYVYENIPACLTTNEQGRMMKLRWQRN